MEHPDVVAAMERVIDLAISHGKAVEPAIGTADRATYQRQRERGIQIFGLTRHNEYFLLREAAQNAMEPFR
jgi:2-keto-3-deoxy-L-rhamnonate aldolase RhmA